MTSYLSIDLDYWYRNRTENGSIKFFRKVFDLGLPIKLATSHEELLPHINKHKADILYNVDTHADLFGKQDKAAMDNFKLRNNPIDGSWGAFVNWRETGCFWWMYSRTIDAGICWPDPGEYDPFIDGYSGWKETKRTKGYQDIKWDSITAVGVAISPDYSTHHSIKSVLRSLGLRCLVYDCKTRRTHLKRKVL